ncbi:autotransporter outer membrane beta-barrel domain-containing protein [Erwinia sp. P7711]|uniref:autotransporter outer membrane beta-barrel domain-containing protein n=1 Tax=Erwinia sp. P7711 TaxID=3141451 RepID=UPI0031941460
MNNKFELSRIAKALLLAGGMGVVPGMVCAAMVGSQSGSEIILGDVTTLIADTSTGDGLYGIIVPEGPAGTVAAGSGTTVSVKDTGNYAKGILLRADNSRFTADKLILNVSGNTATGLELSGHKVSANLGLDSSVNIVAPGMSEGVAIRNASTLLADTLQITTQGDNGTALHIDGYGSNADIGDDSSVQTSGTNSHGIQIDTLTGDAADGAANLKANALTINTLGSGSQGINIQANSTVDLGSNSTIITSGDTSDGIQSLGDLTADHLTISTSGANSAGLSVSENGVANIGPGSVISSVQTGGIVAMGESATVNFFGSAEERNRVQSAQGYGVSAQSTGAVINLQNSDIAITNGVATNMGLWASDGGVINGDALTITGSGSSVGVYAGTDSQVNLTGDLTIDMGSPAGIAMATQHDEGFAPSVISADGKMDITGSIESLGGLIDLSLAAGSIWSGSAVSDNVNGGHLNVNLTDSTWNVAQTSNVDDLQMSNSLVDLSAATDNDTYSTLTIARLSGSGDFSLRTDLVGDGVNNTGDKVVVTESSAGDYGLTIQNRGSAVTTGDEVLTLVETPDGTATFRGNSDVELGGYVYTVNKQGTNWVLSSPKPAEVPAPENTPAAPGDNAGAAPASPADNSAATPTDNTGFTPADSSGAVLPAAPANGSTTPPTEPDGGRVITSTANAGANFLNIGYLMNYAETQTLLQRMGDVRQGKTDGNVWLRGMDGRFSGFASGKMSNFSMNYTGYQFGVDKRLSEELPVYLGLFMGVTEGSPHYKNGDGDTKSESFGLYSTWLNDAGYYLDGVVKINRLRNQFNVTDTQNNRVTGNGVSSGVSASLEAGKKFSFSDNAAGFYLEPQLQLTAGHQDGTSLRASNGLNIDLSSYKSLLGRASVLAGYEINQSDYKLNTYIKTGVMREYSGDAKYALNGSQERHSFQGNGWNNGIGVSARMSNHTLFLEADMVDGERFNQRQVNAGYRFSF